MSRGRYGTVSGTLWRHLKAEQAGDAALGLLARCWSYCADNGTRGHITRKAMLALTAGDAKRSVKLKALQEARFIERNGQDWIVHDWAEWNRIQAAEEEPRSKPKGRSRGESMDHSKGESMGDSRGESTDDSRESSDQQNQALAPPPRAGAAAIETQDPRPKTQDNTDPPNPPEGGEVVQLESRQLGKWERFDPQQSTAYLDELAEHWPGLNVPAGRQRDAAQGLQAHFGRMPPGERSEALRRLARAYREDKFAPRSVVKFLAEGDLTKFVERGPGDGNGPAPPAPHSEHGLGEVSL